MLRRRCITALSSTPIGNTGSLTHDKGRKIRSETLEYAHKPCTDMMRTSLCFHESKPIFKSNVNSLGWKSLFALPARWILQSLEMKGRVAPGVKIDLDLCLTVLELDHHHLAALIYIEQDLSYIEPSISALDVLKSIQVRRTSETVDVP